MLFAKNRLCLIFGRVSAPHVDCRCAHHENIHESFDNSVQNILIRAPSYSNTVEMYLVFARRNGDLFYTADTDGIAPPGPKTFRLEDTSSVPSHTTCVTAKTESGTRQNGGT